MRLPHFTYLVPQNLDEALEVLTTHGNESRILAGGTDLLVRMKQRLVAPPYLVSLKALGTLTYIREAESGSVEIGARTTLAEIIRSEIVRRRYTALAQAAESVGAVSIQHYRGTIGGNLCQENRCQFYNQSAFSRRTRPLCRKAGGTVCIAPGTHKGCRSVCQSDCAPALIALDASVTLRSKAEARTLPLAEFYTGVGKAPHSMKPDELVVEVSLPAPDPAAGSAYMKLASRSAVDYAIVSAAACVSLDKGRIAKAKIAVGAVGPAPILLPDAAKELEGVNANDQGAIEKAGARAVEASAATAVENMPAPLEYRVNMVPVMVTRALQRAVADAQR